MAESLDPSDAMDELAELRRLASRAGPDDSGWEQPPAGLWDRIAAEAGVSAETFPRGDEPSTGGPGPTDHQVSDQPTSEEPDRSAPVTDLTARRRPTWIVGAVAAAVLLVVVMFAVATRTDPDESVVASVALEQLGSAGSGTAELLGADGDHRLRVDLADLDPGDGFLEVWLIDSEVTRMVSLGPVRADGTYDIPSGLDPGEFPVVDVSVEPLDGDPTHSGDSVLRGVLDI